MSSPAYPLTFTPLFKERVWGGHALADLFQKPLPPGVPIGESWEITDRPEGVSVIANGPLQGRDLRWLMSTHARDVLGARGEVHAHGGRFPILAKILDARDKLSLQVHPPAALAAALGGEPKTEMWYIAHAEPGAELYVGLKAGITREEFTRRARCGDDIAGCFHRVPVQTGDAMMLPSGRVHAIGAGLVIFEIQQNSDTTYRVFDWNRVGLDGKPRELHLEASLASIDFADIEPRLIQTVFSRSPTIKVRDLVDDPLFRISAWDIKRGERFHLRSDVVQILAVVSGRLRAKGNGEEVLCGPGGFVLLPACLERTTLVAETRVVLLHVELP